MVMVASSSFSKVRVFPERRVITPLPFTLSEAWANPKLKRHIAKRLTEIPILLLVINFLSILMRRLARANAIEGGRRTELAKVIGGTTFRRKLELDGLSG